jgi:hypothetical protein
MKTLFILVAIAALIAIMKSPQELSDLTGTAHTPSPPIEMPA